MNARMDEQWFGYLLLTISVASVIILFVASLRMRIGKRFWATTLMVLGSSMLLGGTLLAFLLFLLEQSSQQIQEPILISIIFACLFLIGPLLFFIGFFGLCARWGATGRRRTELREITAALSAAQATRTENLSNEPSPHTNIPS